VTIADMEKEALETGNMSAFDSAEHMMEQAFRLRRMIVKALRQL
jgi:hypothetical protein